MYLGAQRVIGNGEPSVTLYLYLHGDSLSMAQRTMLSDVRWIAQSTPGQLARERHEGQVGGRRVVSYLEVTGPDETNIDTLRTVLDVLTVRVAEGSKGPVVHDDWGAELFCGAEIGRGALEELGDLRARLEPFFEDGGTAPPHRELTVEVRRERGETLFAWERESRDRLAARVPAWSPTRLSIIDDVREAFERQNGALFPHVLEMIRPDEVDLEAVGGVAFKDEHTRRVLWFSPGKSG
jgi:hypothetical protein